MRDSDHKIIHKPSEYKIIDFHYNRSLNDIDECWIDITLQKEDSIRRLRFQKPQSIVIHDGFPECPGLFIADVSNQGLEGLKIHVGDYECGPGGIEFWAADVIDLDE